MKRLILLSASIILLLSACEKKEELAYVPSKFPTETKVKKDYSFKIPYKKVGTRLEGEVKVTGTPMKGIFDTGCSFAVSMSTLEFKQMLKNGCVIKSDPTEITTVLADGSTKIVYGYKASYVSLLDTEGQEHIVKDIDIVIREDLSHVLFGLPLLQALGSSFEISDSESAILIRE